MEACKVAATRPLGRQVVQGLSGYEVYKVGHDWLRGTLKGEGKRGKQPVRRRGLLGQCCEESTCCLGHASCEYPSCVSGVAVAVAVHALALPLRRLIVCSRALAAASATAGYVVVNKLRP